MTFLVSGLWHGANWTFVVWGAIHGVAQVFERLVDKRLSVFRKNRIGAFLSWIVVFAFCSVAWVFFRANSIKDAIYVLSHMFTGISQGKHYFGNAIGLGYFECAKIALMVGILSLFDFFPLKTDVIRWIGNRGMLFRWVIYMVLVIIIYLFAHVEVVHLFISNSEKEVTNEKVCYSIFNILYHKCSYNFTI